MKQVHRYLKNTGFILFLICLFAIFIRVLFFVALRPWDEQVVQNKVIIGDSHGYHELALGIIADRTFSGFAANRTPFYPLFIAFIYFLFTAEPWVVLFMQIFLDTAIVIIVYFIAKEIFESKQIPLIAAFLYAINFLSAYYSIRFLTEIMFTFVFALAILTFIRSLKKNKLWGFALTGLLIGIATLTRPIAQYFPPILFIILLFSNEGLGQKLRNMLILLIVFLAVTSTWQFRNLQSYGYYALSIKSGDALCCWHVAAVKAQVENIDRYEAIDRLVGDSLKGVTNRFERSKIYQKIALSYISEHPLQYIKYSLKGVIRIFLGTGRSGISDLFGTKTESVPPTERLSYTAYRIIKNIRSEVPTVILFIKQMIEYAFFAIGLIIMCTENKKLFLLLLIMTIFYFAALTGPIGYSRFRVPIVPFYLLISAKGIFETFKFIINKKRARHITA